MTKRFAAVSYGPLPRLDYSAARPFRSWKSIHLTALIGGWLQQNPPQLELATLALSELTSRRDDLDAQMKFAASGLIPVAWLDDARQAVKEALSDAQASPKGRGRVYVILRHGYTEQNGTYGAYVGSTVKPVEKRFMEHRTGIRSARGLERYGIEPLYSLFADLNPVSGGKTKLREMETRLHEALAPIVPKVTGDVAF
ncbi:hypothetical protein [Coralliovum pocilloporae]|uniref:hypothetical protein n=1 Tax=Coralliovum pocilloporae TaxID=3066369 RepID=UPI003307A3BC